MPGTIERLADTIAALLAREGLDYLQTKAVFKAARQKAGLKAPKTRKGSPARLSLEEELRFIDQAYYCCVTSKPKALISLGNSGRLSEAEKVMESMAWVSLVTQQYYARGGQVG